MHLLKTNGESLKRTMRRPPGTALCKHLTLCLAGAVLFFACSVTPCSAQSMFSGLWAALPLDSIERMVGPLYPRGGLGNTFRSELGTSVSAANLTTAKLEGSITGVLDLRDAMPLDRYPNRYELRGNLRLWRFGLRGAYSFFETRSLSQNLGHFDLSGFSAGCDVDLVQFTWLAAGLAADYYFIQPKLDGLISNIYYRKPPEQAQSAGIRLDGEWPTTVGPYIRYVPPEILGWPVHLEAFWKVPVSGSKLQSYGVALSFRPQIYRFDLSAKLGVERTLLSFQDEPHFMDQIRKQHWRVDMNWDLFRAEVAVYF